MKTFGSVIFTEDAAVSRMKGVTMFLGPPALNLAAKRLLEKELYNLSMIEQGDVMNPLIFKEHLFGRTSDLIGADIRAAAIVNAKRREGELVPQILTTLVHRPNNPWQIYLTNMRHLAHGTRRGPVKPEKGDYDLYYDVFRLDDEKLKRTLWGFPSEEGKTSGRVDCDTVWDSTDPNLDALFD